MGFTEAIKSVFSKYAKFSGRASRSEYWFFQLFNFFIYLILVGIPTVIGAISSGLDGAVETMGVSVIIYYIYCIAVFIPGLAVLVRRLHDTNRSGYNFFWVFLPVIGGILLLVFTLMPSNPGDNAYGEQPQ